MGMDSAGRERPGQASPFPGLRGGMGGMLAMVVLVGLGVSFPSTCWPWGRGPSPWAS